MDYLNEKKIDWNIINSYFNSNNYYFTSSQIESYNDFVLNKIPYTIKTLNPFTMLKKNEKGKVMYEVKIYIVGKEGGEKLELGYKTYRSTDGATGKSRTTIQFAPEFQKKLKEVQ